MGKLHVQWGPRLRRSIRRGRLGLLWPSRLFQGVPDTEVGDAREGSRRRCSVMLALLGC
jgi:hypothetical protein